MRLCILSLTLLVLLPARGQAAPDDEATDSWLAHQLPYDTIFYSQASIPELLKEGQRYFNFIDEGETEGLIEQLKILHEGVKEIGAAYEFEPALMDGILESRVHVIVSAKQEPVVKVQSYQIPKFDPQTNEVIPGEFDETTYETVDHYTLSLVVQTTSELAEDFLEQLKALLGRLKEKTEDAAYDYTEVETDGGEVYAVGGDGNVVGRHGRYIVVADAFPKELWASFEVAPDRAVATGELFQRYSLSEAASLALAIFNIGALVSKTERDLESALQKARADAQIEEGADDANEGVDDRDRGATAESESFEVTMAKAALDTFRVFHRLFGLGQMQTLGANSTWSTGDTTSDAASQVDLLLGDDIPPTLRHIIDGGHKLEVPPLDELEEILVFLRIGVSELYEGIVAGLAPEVSQQLQQFMMMMKAMVGHDASEILAQLAGDVYFLLDLKEKEQETYEYDPATEKVEKKKVLGPALEFFVLLGVKDREGFGTLLTDLMSRLSSSPLPGLAQFLSQREYQGTDVYLIGEGLGEGNDPDGQQSFAMAVVDRYLTFGSWTDLTGVIRRVNSAQQGANRALSAIVEEHKEANFLTVVPNAWSKKFQNFESINNADVPELLKGILTQLLVLSENKDLNERMIRATDRTFAHFTTLSRKANDLAVDPTIINGRLVGQLYRLTGNFKYRKPTR